jgi:PAS domain-containing protein
MSDGTETAAGLPGLSGSADFDRFWILSEDLLVVANQKGEWLRANPSLERILGWTLEEVQALGGREITHPDDRDSASAEIRNLATGEVTLRSRTAFATGTEPIGACRGPPFRRMGCSIASGATLRTSGPRPRPSICAIRPSMRSGKVS